MRKVLADPQGRNYQYLSSLLRYLQWQDGGRRGPWVLKSPTHIGNLDAVFASFPRATLVHCHRDPVTVVTSIARMFEVFWGLFGGQASLHEIGAFALDKWSAEMNKNLAQRGQFGPGGKSLTCGLRTS